MECERAEELRYQQFLAEQQWMARREAAARAHVLPQAGPRGTLQAAVELVGGLRVLPDVVRDAVVGAMRESLHPQ